MQRFATRAVLALSAGHARALSASPQRAWTAPPHRVTSNFPATADAALRNADPEAVFVVTGANRGIGAAMVADLVARTEGTIFACARDSASVAAASGRVRPVALDVRDDESIGALPGAVGGRVDALIHCAGVLYGGGERERRPERSLASVDRAWLLESFDVNCAGPLLVTRALRAALDARKRRYPSYVASLSARVGSINDNGLGGWYSYRGSKAAQNMATRTMAIELRRQDTRCVALHPGTTETALSAPFARNVRPEKLFPAPFSAKQLLDICDGLKDRHSGAFFGWDGEAIDF